MLKNKKLLAFLLASAMMCTAFTACSSEDEDSTESSTAETTEAAESSDEESSDEEESSVKQVEVQEFEEAVVADAGDAYLSIVDGQWWLQYWGSDMDYLTYDAGVVEITGDGTYTVSVTCDTDAIRYDTTGDANGELIANGSEFMAVQIMDGADMFPDAVITIDSVTVDGTDMELTASSYTNAEEAAVDDVTHNNIRANVYNAYVSDLPDDAKSTEGLLSDLADSSAYSSTIIDNNAIGDWTTIEVTFTVTGTGL